VHVAVIQSGTLVASWSGIHHVEATAILNGQLFVARFNVGQVSVYDTASLQLLRQIALPGLALIGLATSSVDNYLYASDSMNRCVYGVDLTCSNTSVVTWSVLPGAPLGISTTSTGNVLVVIAGYGVKEYTSNGSLVRQITNRNSLWHAIEINKDIWAFTVSGPMNGICTTLTNGTLLKCFSGSEARSGITPMTDTRSLAVGTRGYILVADWTNNRILTVNPSLNEAHEFALLPNNVALTSPITISFDESRGRLYVGEDGGQLRVLVFDGKW